MTATPSILAKLVAAVKMAAMSFSAVVLRHNATHYESELRRHLKFLATEIFSCFLEDDYPENVYFYERGVHKEKINSLYWLSRLRSLKDGKSLQNVLTLLLDAGQLRRRVADHSTFKLCEKELLVIDESLNQVLDLFGKKSAEMVLVGFAAAIDQFEDCFVHVINVAARDPVVFILFIESLRALHELAVEHSHE
jgi:hypothetical protein